ncbi:MAG: PPE domain-containing protein, partial [Pseudonocardiaceae bacterium]
MVLGPLGDAAEAVGSAARSAYEGVTGTVASVFGSDPSGNDGGSSTWEAWGHPELYSMVRDTVDPADIQEGAAAYRQVGTRVGEVFAGITGDLDGIVQGGWRGRSANAATGALAPMRDWSAELSQAVSQTSDLMGSSGDSAEQARRDVPEPVDFNTAQTLRSAGSGLLSGGPAGALLGGGIDAVAQERAQDEARQEAVRVMNTAYSPPLLQSKDSVPDYPRPTNPTTVPPEGPPDTPPPPGPGGPGRQGPGSGGTGGGGSTGSQPYQQPGGAAVSSPTAAPSGPVGTGGQAA